MGSEREIRRRKILALTGGAVASLAGCPGDGGAGTETQSAVESPTDTADPTPTTAESTTDTATPTATPTDTASPTPTPSPNAFADEFADTDLGDYRAVTGSLAPWSITSKIDDGSALVDTTGGSEGEDQNGDGGVASLIAPGEGALTWEGTGTITLDFQFGTGPAFRNCKLAVGDVIDGASTVVQLTPRQLLVSAPDGNVSQQFPEIGAQGVHRVAAGFDDGTITITVDDEHEVSVTVDERLPAGTVAFGIEGDRATTGGKTWFDNLDVVGET